MVSAATSKHTNILPCRYTFPIMMVIMNFPTLIIINVAARYILLWENGYMLHPALPDPNKVYKSKELFAAF
ncbi:hypothetical protein KHA80_10820 [Anaerobacillus sp. HL2]|nr:hypothetical protein KHA80_10820 [Anaerobacillus sp. HL2]